MISRIYLLSKMKLMILEAILDLESILSMALIANRWHTQIRFIWGRFICKATNWRGMGKWGETQGLEYKSEAVTTPSPECVREDRGC